MTGPSYTGAGLVNLVAELERRLAGTAPLPGLDPDRSAVIPGAATYVLLLIDGLGAHQLSHPAAATLAEHRRSTLQAPFPTTTTVSLATVATGLAPAGHGVIGHLMWLPELGEVVNTLKWVTLRGVHLDHPTRDFLPAPNLWERVGRAGLEAITVQPANFQATPLTRALYRGCRFEPTHDYHELVAATVALASVPGRLVFTYLPNVDYAAHVHGLGSAEYAAELARADTVWSRLAATLPAGATLVGTADHGLIDYPESGKHLVRDPEFRSLVFYGDPRAVMVRGDGRLIEKLAAVTGAEVVAPERALEWWGGGVDRHPELDARAPEAVLLAPRGALILPRGFDRRLVGYHGGLEPAEVEVPLLVASG